MDRHSYKIYKDDRECLTKKVINRSMYIILNAKMKPVVLPDGGLLIFYKRRQATRFMVENKNKDQDWRVKKIQLDVTML
mgnify:CR=1 FL=1|tara:strand:- start:160783 stop:161019 length:237 start_codon:yes stop_codon:yes gene_type:complete